MVEKNPWTLEDERVHFPSALEWWAVEAFYKSIENKNRWSLKAAFNEWLTPSEEIGSIFNFTLFDQDKDKHYVYYLRSDLAKLNTKKERFFVGYDDSYIKGSYPNYEMLFFDKKNNIKLEINYLSESLPHWVLQDVTDGWLPMGVGNYRYGFIPKNKLSGKMIIGNEKFSIKGKGYFEHVWGDFLYENPLSNVSELKKTISIYSKLLGWWLHNHRAKIPKSIKFTTENNPFGYDWIWSLFDNEWTLFYGNALFWIMEGPILGSLILSKDGKTYKEFCNVSFRYKNTRHAKNHDFYYPTGLEITAKYGKEKLYLEFKMTNEPREYDSKFHEGKYWLGLLICEAPGTVNGYYSEGTKKIKLSGICKIEAQRQPSIIGHNSLNIDFLKPPKGVGVSFDFNSHYLQKKIYTKIQLAPRPKLKFSFEKINNFKKNQS